MFQHDESKQLTRPCDLYFPGILNIVLDILSQEIDARLVVSDVASNNIRLSLFVVISGCHCL